MKKLTLIIMFFFLLLNINLISSEFGASFEKGECVDLIQTCDNCTYVNISSIKYPNSTKLNLNEVMTKDGIEYNYTFCSTNSLGQYQYTVFGNKDGEVKVETITFEITPNGQRFDTGQSLGGLGIFIGLLAVGFAFIFIGSNLIKEDKTLPFGFFFMVMSVFMVLASLYFGWAFSVDILQHETLSEGVARIFSIVLWTSMGVTLIFFSLMLIAFIRELGKILDKKKFGEDFNPVTGIYE